MRTSVQLLNTLVLVTIAAACAPRARHVVETPSLVAASSAATDADAHATKVVALDQGYAHEISALKSEVKTLAEFDFFWDREKLVYPIYRTGWWEPAVRVELREKLARILALTEKRRAFQDDENLQWDWQRAHETVGHFDQRAAFDASLTAKGAKHE